MNYKEQQYLLNALGIKDKQSLKPFAKKNLEIKLKLREQGIPLAKLIQKKPFMNDYFITTFDTLDPRPETEFIVEQIPPFRKILELGVGTGCIILSLLKKFQKAKGIGIDICPKALKIASLNAQILKLNKQITFMQNNWAHGMKEEVDLVICNPPYVSKNENLNTETLQDPSIALFGDQNTYEQIMQSLKNVKFKKIIFEVPEILLRDIETLLKNYNLQTESLRIYNTDIFMLSGT